MKKKENKQEEQDEKLTAILYQSKVKWLSKHKSVSSRTIDVVACVISHHSNSHTSSND